MRNTESSAEKRRAYLLFALLALSFSIYANSLLNGFVYDDHNQIEENPYVHSGKYIGKILTTTVLSFRGQEGVTNYYRPMMTLSFLVCQKLFSGMPFGFHLVNVLLHCAIVFLVFQVSSVLFDSEAIGFVSALIFAVHPVHTESVDWISGITDLQLAFFVLLVFWQFLKLHRRNTTFWTYCFLGLAYFAALLSKEQALMLAPLATFYEHFLRPDRQQTNWKQKASRYGFLWGLAMFYFALRFAILGKVAPVSYHKDVTNLQAIYSGFALVYQYVLKMLVPEPLGVFWIFKKSEHFFSPAVLAGVLILVLSIVLFAWFWKRNRAYCFAILWFFVTLGPVFNAKWMAVNVFAERYLYLPSVGFCWLIAGLVIYLWRLDFSFRRLVRVAVAASMAFVVVYSCKATVWRNREWADDTSLARSSLALQPNASYLRSDLAAVEWSKGRREEAERQWLLALQDKPDNPAALANLGMAKLEEKKYDEALQYLNLSLKARPFYTNALIQRGILFEKRGEALEAESNFREAVRVAPLSTSARNHFGSFLLSQERFAEAEQQFIASIEAIPTAEAWQGLAAVYYQRKDSRNEEIALTNVLKINPFINEAHLRMGEIYLERRDLDAARKEFQAVLLMDPQNEKALAGMKVINSSVAR